MLFRLVRPVKRFGSSMNYFVQRIPADVRARAVGLRLAVPLGAFTQIHLITAKAHSVRFSLRTRDPSETKIRNAAAAAYVETVWHSLRATEPTCLSHKQATALAGESYRAWADDQERETTLGITWTPKGWVPDRATPEEDAEAFKAAAASLDDLVGTGNAARLETAVGPIVDRLLLARGIAGVDHDTRAPLLDAFILALRDAMHHRERNAGGDYSPDPKATRFPEWKRQEAQPKAAQPQATFSLTGLLDDWWREAKAAVRKPSTHESYRNTMASLVAFLGHDDASRVNSEDLLRYKNHRLATINPRTGKHISAKTVKDSDLAGLKTSSGWAVSNRRMPTNPATGIAINTRTLRPYSVGAPKPVFGLFRVANQGGSRFLLSFGPILASPGFEAWRGARRMVLRLVGRSRSRRLTVGRHPYS